MASMRSLLSSRVARMAMAPAGAVATMTTTSVLMGEHTTSRASSRIAGNTATTFWQQQQQRRMLSSGGEKMSTIEAVTKQNVASQTIPADKVVATPQRKSFMQWYDGHLQSKPVATKMVSGSILWGAGDCVAQTVPRMIASDKADLPPFTYDWPRTGRAVFFGFAIHAPCSHLHFNFLEWMTVRFGITGLYIPLFKTFMEQFVYWSWFSNSLYHGAMGAMQGQNLSQIYQRIADVLWETQKAQWVFWIPIQILNFRFIPVRHQLNVVLLTSIVWTALLSAWYPPVSEQEGNEQQVNDKVDENKSVEQNEKEGEA